MADNLTIPVATNEVGGWHYQKMKLIDGADGSTVGIEGDATNGLDVDVTRMPGQFAEDTAHGSGDIGNLLLAVRLNTGAALAGTDGNYSPLQVDADGSLRVTVASGGGGGVQYAEDSSHASGNTGTMALVVRKDSAGTLAGTDGDYAPLQVDANGSLRVTGGTATIQYTEDATSAGAESLCLAGAVRRDSAASSAGADGDYATLNVDANGRLYVACDTHAISTVSTVTTLSQFGGNAINLGNGAVGTGTLRVTIANDSTGVLATVSTLTTLTGGGVAHDAADSGNPVKIGSRSIAALSGGTAVAAADRSDLLSDLDGAIIVREDCPFGDLVSGNATNTDGTSTQCIAASGSGVKTVLTDITLCNSSATAVTVDIKDGSTVKWTFPVPAGGGVTHSWKKSLVGTANTAWNFDPSAAASTITCSMSGYKTKV